MNPTALLLAVGAVVGDAVVQALVGQDRQVRIMGSETVAVARKETARMAITLTVAMAGMLIMRMAVVTAVTGKDIEAGVPISESISDFYSQACCNFADDARRCACWCCCVPSATGLGPTTSRLSNDANPDVLPRGEP